MSHEIHIINPLRNAHGGSEWEAISLFEMLSAAKSPDTVVKLWSNQRRSRVSRYFGSRYPIQCISRFGFKFPRKGTFIFVGSSLRLRLWFQLSKPSRVIIIYNFMVPDALERLYERSQKICQRVEVVHISEWMRNTTPYKGVIHYSPIDLKKFHPDCRRPTGQFTVGRLSRDTKDKFSDNDPALFRLIADAGCSVRLMGATVLGRSLAEYRSIEIMPVSIEDAEDFLGSLDCFIYRTNASWTEPFGRVIMEAMACGLPVVCENRGGYVELIEHGKNGFLFENNEEAIAIIEKLKSDPELCLRIGEQARLSMELIYTGEQLEKRKAYYLASGSDQPPQGYST